MPRLRHHWPRRIDCVFVKICTLSLLASVFRCHARNWLGKELLLCPAVFMAVATLTARAETAFQNFVTVRGDQLMDGPQPFRFISWNLPNLLVIEDNLPFAQTNAWRLPEGFEIRDGLMTVRQMGGTVARTYSLAVVRTNDDPDMPGYVLGPGKFNEDAFRRLDLVLQAANEQGIRLIIPLVNNWKWQGGRGEYAGFRGKSKDEFWTGPQLIADFKETIRFVLTRTNTLTGVRYCDDKAILCWETGNELSSPPAWTREIAAYLKSVDTNHLVMDGYSAAVLRPESLAIPEIDIVTTHHYPSSRMKQSFADLIRDNWAKARGKKAYVVGEFGFVSTAQMEDAMKTIMDSGMSGGLLWSLRFRDRDGGFYWHSEPDGADLYKAFHWPGSAIGEPYDEKNLMRLVRSNAFAIRGLAVPSIPALAPPTLLPITDPGAISWQGSVGATGYQVERAAKKSGDWQIISANVDEAFTQYRPDFADETVPAGKWFYRVRARNEAGLSAPSNVVGPVKAKLATLVDELADFSRTQNHPGDWQIANHDCRSAKEDAHRAAGVAGDALVYQLPSAIRNFRVFAFFPKAESDVKFSISKDGINFRLVAAQKEDYFHGAGDYNYSRPVLFHAQGIHGGTFLRLELTGETQISRVEVSHKALSQ
jgi:hypothetical protein